MAELVAVVRNLLSRCIFRGAYRRGAKMQSKRALYKPASTEVGTREKRKPLAQGRLFTQKGPTLFSSDMELEKPSDQDMYTLAASNSQLQQSMSSPCDGTGSFSARKKLDSQSSQTSIGAVPRYETPKASFSHSPAMARPSHSLELSDSDSDVRRNTSDVLLVDASRQTLGPDEYEVDIQVGYVQSPAKVICHTAEGHKNSPEGDVTRARQIEVDIVPAIKAFSISEQSDDSELDIPRQLKYEKNRSHSHDSRDTRPRHPVDEEVAQRAASRSISQMARDIKEKVKKKKTAAIQVPSRYMQTAKPSESRGPMKATDRGIMGRTANATLGRSNGTTTGPQMHAGKRSTPGGAKSSTPLRAGANSSARSNKSSGSSGGSSFGGRTRGSKKSTAAGSSFSTQFSSTPGGATRTTGSESTLATDSSMFHAPGADDLSAITDGGLTDDSRYHQSAPRSRNAMDDSTRSSSGATRTKTSKDSMTESMMESSAYQAPHHTTKAKAKATSVSQQQLDLKYGRYIQWVFLESKFRKAFQEQDMEAMKQVHALWQQTQELSGVSTQLDIEINKQKHLKNVDESINLQLVGLCPVAESVGTFTRQYETLAAALDTTRHQIAVKGISVPNDQKQFADSLQRALCETQQLLGELSHMTRHQTPGVTEFSRTISAVDDTVSTELHELSRCQELVSAANSLATHEASLLIHAIQSTAT